MNTDGVIGSHDVNTNVQTIIDNDVTVVPPQKYDFELASNGTPSLSNFMKICPIILGQHPSSRPIKWYDVAFTSNGVTPKTDFMNICQPRWGYQR
jgi:hypothetical protein